MAGRPNAPIPCSLCAALHRFRNCFLFRGDLCSCFEIQLVSARRYYNEMHFQSPLLTGQCPDLAKQNVYGVFPHWPLCSSRLHWPHRFFLAHPLSTRPSINQKYFSIYLFLQSFCFTFYVENEEKNRRASYGAHEIAFFLQALTCSGFSTWKTAYYNRVGERETYRKWKEQCALAVGRHWRTLAAEKKRERSAEAFLQKCELKSLKGKPSIVSKL